MELCVNEVSNLDMTKDSNILKEEMSNKMEKLFLLAVQYTADYPDLLEGLRRLDSMTRDCQSRQADQALDRLWVRNRRPANIALESLKLQADSAREKEEVFGRQVGRKG